MRLIRISDNVRVTRSFQFKFEKIAGKLNLVPVVVIYFCLDDGLVSKKLFFFKVCLFFREHEDFDFFIFCYLLFTTAKKILSTHEPSLLMHKTQLLIFTVLCLNSSNAFGLNLDSLGGSLDPIKAAKEKLLSKIPVGDLEKVSKKPEEACQQYNKYLEKMNKKVTEINLVAEKLPSFVRTAIFPNFEILPDNSCVQTSKLSMPICEKFNKAKLRVEKTLSKSAIIVFEEGKCKSAIDVIEKKILVQASKYLPSNSELTEAAMETPGKACEYYAQTLEKTIKMFTGLEKKIQGFVKKTSVFKTVNKISPEHAPKLLPSFGFQFIGDGTVECGSNSSDFSNEISKRFLETFDVCEKFNGNIGSLKKKMVENVEVVFDEEGQCRAKNWVDYLLQFIGMVEESGVMSSGGEIANVSYSVSWLVACLGLFFFVRNDIMFI